MCLIPKLKQFEVSFINSLHETESSTFHGRESGS